MIRQLGTPEQERDRRDREFWIELAINVALVVIALLIGGAFFGRAP